MFDREELRAAFDALHASEDTIQEVMNMTVNKEKTKRRFRPRTLAALLAAAVLLLGTVTALATGGFGLYHRQPSAEERFPLYWSGNEDAAWSDVKLALTFEGPEEAHAVRFRPGWLPRNLESSALSIEHEDGWYTYLTTEGRVAGLSQPCMISVYYAPMFVNGGNLVLIDDKPREIREEYWGEYQMLSFETDRDVTLVTGEEMHWDGSYCLLYHPADGYVIVVCGQLSLDDMVRVAQSLEIEQTDEILRAEDYREENHFFDWGVG